MPSSSRGSGRGAEEIRALIEAFLAAGKPVSELGYMYAFAALMVAFMIAAGAVTAIAAVMPLAASAVLWSTRSVELKRSDA